MNRAASLLERLGALMQQATREDAARQGLQPIHLQMLNYLAQANRYSDSPVAVAEYFGVTRGTVSQSIAVLERKGLLRKRPDAHHGKRLHLELTPAGERALKGSWAQRVETALKATASQDFESGLYALLRALQQANGQSAFGICRECAHFLREPGGARCGLTGEPLAEPETGRLCREWSAPDTATPSRPSALR